MQLAEAVLTGNRRMLARAISLVENEDPARKNLLQALHPHTGKAMILGITGSPGSGKSSLVNKLIKHVRDQGKTVGIIAVDPTSPFTGGAILGDRIRMQEHALDPGVFIRSMGTRGSLGGLSRATKDAVQVLDAFGKDLVIIETVGVGQSEVDIVKTADTTAVVLTPAGGDSVQTIKAGIMEIADIFVLNKSDLPGADRTRAEIEMMLDLSGHHSWRPPIVQTIALKDQGSADFWQAVTDHRRYLEESGRLQEIRRQRIRTDVMGIVEYTIKNKIWHQISGSARFEGIVEKILTRRLDPYSAAEEIMSFVDV